jgi:lipopolysaccharide/colanic/teichoic acid biosynthesis glycosyltransferase
MGLSVRRFSPERSNRWLAADPRAGSGSIAPVRILVVGAGPGLPTLRAWLATPDAPVASVAVTAPRAADVPHGWQYLGPVDGIEAHLDRGYDVAVLCLEDGSWHLAHDVVRACLARGIQTTIAIPDSGAPLSGSQQRLKRAVDVIGAATGLVLLSPLLAATALAIRIRDGSPVMFRQHRAGRNGVPFEILKFRTMGHDADARRAELRASNEVTGGASFKMARDPRVTSLGRWLRKTSIDELPQLWNVLRGEMSLVGPRPHPYDDLSGYRPWHLRRLEVNPGITGLWQVELRNDGDFDRWVQKDIEYIERWSIWLDASILLRTIPSVIRGDGR